MDGSTPNPVDDIDDSLGPFYEGTVPDVGMYPYQYGLSGTSLFALTLRYRTVGLPLSFFAEAGPAVTAIWAPVGASDPAYDHYGVDVDTYREALNDLEQASLYHRYTDGMTSWVSLSSEPLRCMVRPAGQSKLSGAPLHVRLC